MISNHNPKRILAELNGHTSKHLWVNYVENLIKARGKLISDFPLVSDLGFYVLELEA